MDRGRTLLLPIRGWAMALEADVVAAAAAISASTAAATAAATVTAVATATAAAVATAAAGDVRQRGASKDKLTGARTLIRLGQEVCCLQMKMMD